MVKGSSCACVEKVISSIATLGRLEIVQFVSQILQISTCTDIIWWQLNIVVICCLLNSSNVGKKENVCINPNRKAGVVLLECFEFVLEVNFLY